MTTPTQSTTFVGIDVATAELVAAERPSGALTTWANDEAGHAALVAHLRPVEPALIVLEGTGGLEVPAAAALQEAGLPVVVANPRQVRDFARGLGRLAKTDALDAAILAQFAELVRPAVRPRPDAAGRRLAALVARRRQVTELRVREQQHRLRATAEVRTLIDASLTRLTADLRAVEALIAEAIALDPAVAATAALLESVRGVGPVTAATLVAELPELGTGEAGGLAALAGLAPLTKQSGLNRGHAAIAGGRATVRRALYLAAVTAVRHNPVVKAFYDRLLTAGKPRKVALIACAHKLLAILHALVRDGATWDPVLPADAAA